MPSHLYINTGHYHAGTEANERAVKVDSAYVESCHEAGIYPLAYYPHNWHFLAACAALEGRGNRALEASRYMADFTVNQELMYDPVFATLQHYYTIPWYIMVKFAMWDKIINEPAPDPELKYPTAVWNYARGMAFAARGNYPQATSALERVQTIATDTSIAKLTIWDINSIKALIELAAVVLDAEIAQRQGDLEKSIRLLTEAVALEDNLNYNEPPDWFFSVRHLLGNVLLKANKYQEAEAVYRQDLLELKENGWALIGLARSLVGQERHTEASEVRARFQEAWKYADQGLQSSVISGD